MPESAKLILHVDGGARGNPGAAAAGVVLCDVHGTSLLEAGYLLGTLTNNQAEYNALVLGLRAAHRWRAEELSIYSDSELLVRQIIGQYRVKSADLKPLYADAQRRLLKFGAWQIQHVKREDNKRADELVNQALDLNKDIVDVERFDEPEAALESAVADQPPSDAQWPAVLVRVVGKASTEPCSARCVQGQQYTIDRTLPGELGVHAAASLLEALQQLSSSPSAGKPSEPLQVRCGRCGAVFQISPLDVDQY